MQVVFTIKIFVIAIIAFLVISAWNEVIERTLMKYFNMDKEDINTWLKIAVVSTFILFIIIMSSNIEVHDLFGVSETVDTQLTGMTEKIKNGKVKHYTSK